MDRLYKIKNIPRDEVDLLRKTAGTFAQVVGKEISLSPTDSEMSYVGWERARNRFVIGIDKNDDGLKKITKTEHELSHIIFKTDVKELDKCMERIMENTPTSEKFPDFKNKAWNFAKQLYNILEDERIESNYGDIYAGSKKQFQLSKETHHKINKPTGELDPVGAVFCARFLHDDVIDGSDWEIAKEFLKQTHHKDEKAGIILTKMYWDKYVCPWLQKQLDELEDKPKPKSKEGESEEGEGDGKGSGSTVDEKLDDFEGKSDADRKKEIDKVKSSIEAKEKKLGETTKDKARKEKVTKRLEKLFSDAKKQSGHDRVTVPDGDPDPIDFDDLEGELEQSKENFEMQIEEIREALDNPIEMRDADGRVLLERLTPKYVLKIDRPVSTVNPDIQLSRGLNKMFKRIKGKFTDTIETAGMEIDMEEYIQSKVKRTGEFWVEEVEAGGLSIVIGVDLSGSMGSHRITVCRNMCATLFKSLEGIDKVDLKIVAWSSPSSQYKLSVTDIKKYEDVRKITSASGHGQNANHMAHQYIDEMLRKSTNQKRLCIMLTDGVPWMSTGRREYDMDTLLDLTKQAIDETRRHGNKVFGIYIGDNETEVDLMRKMYGTDFVAVDEIEQARTKVVRAFEAHVVREMRST